MGWPEGRSECLLRLTAAVGKGIWTPRCPFGTWVTGWPGYVLPEVIVEGSIKPPLEPNRPTEERAGVNSVRRKDFMKAASRRKCQVFSLPVVVKLHYITWRTCPNRLQGPIPRDSNLVGPGWISRVCILHEISGMADSAGL